MKFEQKIANLGLQIRPINHNNANLLMLFGKMMSKKECSTSFHCKTSPNFKIAQWVTKIATQFMNHQIT